MLLWNLRTIKHVYILNASIFKQIRSQLNFFFENILTSHIINYYDKFYLLNIGKSNHLFFNIHFYYISYEILMLKITFYIDFAFLSFSLQKPNSGNKFLAYFPQLFHG